jgi:hypothetical protein
LFRNETKQKQNGTELFKIKIKRISCLQVDTAPPLPSLLTHRAFRFRPSSTATTDGGDLEERDTPETAEEIDRSQHRDRFLSPTGQNDVGTSSNAGYEIIAAENGTEEREEEPFIKIELIDQASAVGRCHTSERSLFMVALNLRKVPIVVNNSNQDSWIGRIFEQINRNYLSLAEDDFVGVTLIPNISVTPGEHSDTNVEETVIIEDTSSLIHDKGHHLSLDGIHLPLRKWKHFDSSIVLQKAEQVAQSNRIFRIDLPFYIILTTIRNRKRNANAPSKQNDHSTRKIKKLK